MSQIKHYTTTLGNDNQPQYINNLEDGAVVYAKNTTTGASRLYIKEQVSDETPVLTNIGESLDKIDVGSMGTDGVNYGTNYGFYNTRPKTSIKTNQEQEDDTYEKINTIDITTSAYYAFDGDYTSSTGIFLNSKQREDTGSASILIKAGICGRPGEQITTSESSVSVSDSGVTINTPSNKIEVKDMSNNRVKISSSKGLLISSDVSASIELPYGDPYVNINGDTSIDGTLDVSGGIPSILTNSITCSKDISGDTYKIYLSKGSSQSDYPEISFSFKSGESNTENKLITAGYYDDGGDVYGAISCNGNITTSGTVSSSGYLVKNGNNTSFSVGTNGAVVCGGSLTVKNFVSVSMSRSEGTDVYRIYGNSFGHGLFEIGAAFSGGDKGHCICYAPNATTSAELDSFRNGAAPRYYICPNKYFSIYTFLDNILYVDFSDYPTTFDVKFLIKN